MNFDTIADFTWFWNDEFFLETDEGNYIWSSPEYNGDNTIRRYNGSLSDYISNEAGCSFGRDKGRHRIRDYCGDSVKLEGSTAREKVLP